MKIRWTTEAERWLRDIHDYMALHNPDAAKKVVLGVFEKVQVLQQFPEIGQKYRSEKRARSEFCFMDIIELLTW